MAVVGFDWAKINNPSEYVPAAYMRRAFLSGFQGSAGTAVVTATTTTTTTTATEVAEGAADTNNDGSCSQEAGAWLWTDSRYWNEAGLQLDPQCWELQKAGLPDTPTLPKWLASRALAHYKATRKPLHIGIDPFVTSASFAKEVLDALTEASNAEDWPTESEPPTASSESSPSPPEIGVLVSEHDNLIDPIWGTFRPAIPTSPFRVHPLEYAGVTVVDKVSKVRKEMQDKKATLAVFSTLDDVAYLFNLRSQGDVETCPVGIAYATIAIDEITLYCDEIKLGEEGSDVRNHLNEAGVVHRPYDAIVNDIPAHLEGTLSSSGGPPRKVWMDKSRTNYGLVNLVPTKALIDAKTALTDMKAAKNEAELQGMRQAHIVDGVAMAHFMAWLEHAIVVENRTVSEVEIDLKLTGYRAQQPGFVEVSFPTIAGVGPNGAIIHYRASPDSAILRHLDAHQPILIDSGGQYLYGTTDVTRSWHFGTNPAPEYIDAYTRVLKGHIGLDELIFPENTPGFALDIYARRWLWDAQKDYGHGTGHGVGAALNVHEGPMSISPRWNNKEGLKAGMVVSNEPGYYEDGNFGIRIENLIEIQYVNPADAEDETKDEVTNTLNGEPGAKKAKASDNKKKYLQFKKLTMIPIQKNLIDVSLMTTRELDWLDAYHDEVFAKVSPLLEADSLAMTWLVKSCAKIERP